VEADDDRAARIERQLVADVPAAEQLAEEPALAGWQPDEDPARCEIDRGHVVLAAVDPEPPAELVHRHVRTALDEAAELGSSAAHGWLRSMAVRPRGVAVRMR